jgi:alpha-beta hydrolase superfamily lysophospholipase
MKKYVHLLIAIITLLLDDGRLQAQGLPRRTSMGINFGPITDSIQKQFHLPDKNGIIARKIYKNTSAQLAGVESGDIITHINDSLIKDNPQHFAILVKPFKQGDKLTFTLYRQGKKLRKQIRVLPIPQETNPRFETIYSAIKVGNNHLRVIMTKPKCRGPYPAVLLIQEDNCYSIEYPYEKEGYYPFIDSLTSRGLATFRLELSGVGDSKGMPCGQSFDQTVVYFQACLGFVKQQAFVDSANVFLYGHGEGGVIAPIIANQNPVKGIIVFGSFARSKYEYTLANLRRMNELGSVVWRWRARQGPMPYDSLETITKTYASALQEFLMEKQSPQAVMEKYPSVKTYFSVFKDTYKYPQELAQVNIAYQWKRLDTHVLALYGKADYLAFEEDHQLIAKIVNREHENRAVCITIPQTDHNLNRVDTFEQSVLARKTNSQNKNHTIVQLIYEWIDERL